MPLDYLDKYDVAGEASESILGKVKNFAVATSADFVSTLYNSTVGLVADDIRTEDILAKTDQDALAFYNEHKEGVEAASFIAGVAAPGLSAVKLLNRAKAGMAAFGGSRSGISGAVADVFSGKKATTYQTDLRKIFEDGGYGTTEYTSTMRKLYASKVGENFLDAALFEGITIGTLNAHPYMEDYMQSPFSNFAFWGAAGGAIGSTIAAIGVKHAVRTALGAAEKEAISSVFSRVDPLDLGATTAERYQTHSTNVSNLESLVSAEANPNQLTRDYTLNAIQDQRAARERVIAEAAPFLEKLPKDEQKEIRPLVEGILADSRFINVQKIKIPSLGSTSKESKGALEFDKDTEVMLADDKGKNKVMFYRPASGELFDRSGAKNAALAVDLRGYSVSNNVPLAVANNDFLIEAMSRLVPSAKIDARYLDELATWEAKVKPQALQYVTIATNDLPRQNAAIRWLAKQSQKVQEEAKFFVKNEQASHNDFVSFVEKGGAGVKPTHLQDITNLIEKGGVDYISNPVSKQTSDVITAWIHGGEVKGKNYSYPEAIKRLRQGFSDYFTNARTYNEELVWKEAAEEMWQQGSKFRSEMAKLADADGYVYLYRGSGNRELKHHSPIESYTPVSNVASNFGASNPKPIKVHVDNLIGTFGTGNPGEAEILVAPAHNKIVDNIPVLTQDNKTVTVPSSGSKDVMNGEQLVKFYHQNVTNAVNEMSGYSHMVDESKKIEAAFKDALKDFSKLELGDVGKGSKSIEDLLTTANQEMIAQYAYKDNPEYKWWFEKMEKFTEKWETKANELEGLANPRSSSFEEISAKLNLTKEAAVAIAAGTDPGAIPQAFRYTDAKQIAGEYLNPKNKMLGVTGNPYKTDMAPALANLDNRLVDTAHQQIVQFFTEASNSELAKALMNVYSPLADSQTRKSMLAGLQILKQELGEVNNQLIGSPTFQTVDNALRKIQSGPLLAYLGKQIQNITDKQIEKLLTPVANSFASMRNNATAIVESEILRNRLLSLSGWRDIRVEAETGFGYIVQRENRADGVVVEVPLREKDGSTFYIRQKEVTSAFESMRDAGQQMYELHNLQRKIRGQKPVNDLGFYIPPPPIVGKSIAYVMDKSGLEKTKLLYGNSEEELRSLIASYKSEVIANNPQYRIVVGHGEDLRDFNLIQQYQEGEMFVNFANNELRHGGSSASAVIKPDARGINEMIEGWEYQVLTGMRKFHRLYLDDVFQKLDFLSDVNQQFIEGQPIKGVAKAKATDAARTVMNTLLGKGNLEENTIWKNADDVFSRGIQMAAGAFSNTVKTFKGQEGSLAHFDQISKDLDQLGIKNPWESYDLYSKAAMSSSSPQIAKRYISAQNGLLSTLQLRLADASFSLVNTMSLPILLNASVMEGLPKTELPNGSKVTLPIRLMYDAMRMYFNPEGKQLIKEWTETGLITSPTRQYVDMVGKIKSPVTTKDAADEVISTIEGFQKSKAVQFLSKPADFTESFTREFAMLTGYLAAKHAYPSISNIGATIHASSVADRAIGNYYSSQRPTIFQGALGSMLGLYQTYLMSFAQSVYRGIENRNFVQLAQTAGLQAGIFGTASWPGYNLLSETIGKYLSNQNYDLTTGTYRAVGDTTAQLVLYGLPSWLGPSFYTRGDITPRVPSFDNLAIVNTLTSSYNAMGRLVSGLMSQPGVEGKLQSVGESLSLQSLNRPLARVSEILTGESITSKGQTVSTNTEVWTPMGVMSRLLAVRPLEEQVTRNALHLNSYYGAVDYENRQRIVNKLRTAIRANDIPDDLIDKTASEYLLKGGTSKGWTDVMNQVMIRSEQGTRMDLMRKLEPDSPLRRMISETF